MSTGRSATEACPNFGHFGLSDRRDIAVIRLDEIGDLVLTFPLLRELRRNTPQANITLAVNPAVLNLVETCPYVDRVVAVPVQQRRGGWGELTHGAVILDHARKNWWSHPCDLALLPRFGADMHDARLLAYMIGASTRIGFGEADYFTNRSKKFHISPPFLLTQRISHSEVVIHEVERNLSLLRLLGGKIEDSDLEVWITPQDSLAVEKILDPDDGRPIIAICPSAGHARRRWPIARFASVINEILEWPEKPRIVIIGSSSDLVLTAPFSQMSGDRVTNLCGRFTLRQTAALLRRTHLYVGSDTGPMHIAAAAGASVLEISCHPVTGDPGHENSPVRFGPWHVPSAALQPPASVPCTSYCSADEAHCILGISVDDVLTAVRRLLNESLIRRARS